MNKLLAIFTLLILETSVDSKFLGRYHAKLHSVDDYKDIPKDKVDWRLYIQKVNKTIEALAGHMFIKENLEKLGLTLHMEQWCEGGYKNFQAEGMNTENVCTDKIYKQVMGNYNGTMNSECSFHAPQRKVLTPFILNDELHRYLPATVLGKFRVGMRFHAGKRDVMGFQVVLEFIDMDTLKWSSRKGKLFG